LADKPSEELRAFAKTKALKPGKSEKLKFTLKAKDLASFIDEQSAWITEKGIYTVKIGASSLDIQLTEDFSVAKDITVEKVNNVFDLDAKMETLKN